VITKQHILRNIQTNTKAPPMDRSDRYRPGQTFDVDRFAAICSERNLDPAEAAVKLLQKADVDLKDKEKLDAYIRLMEFLYSKKKAVELTGKDGGPVEVTDRPQLTREEWLKAHGLAAAAGSTD
jgi:hypothetical protein